MVTSVLSGTKSVELNKVIRNTYALLALSLLWSTAVATFALVNNVPPVGIIVYLVGFFGLYFGLQYTANSAWGLVFTFLFTGFLGYILGPILNHYLSLPGGSEIVVTSLGLTAIAFLGLSGYVLMTGKDFSFMGGFMFVGGLVILGAGILNIFLAVPALQLAISAAVVFLMCGYILYTTSALVHGGETNYIRATSCLYLSIFNLFTALLQLLGFARSE